MSTGMRFKASFRWAALLALLVVCVAAKGASQQASAAQSYPAQLPYSFGNFVWWSDGDLRALLKKRIPGLGDEIGTNSAKKSQIRDTLTALLREKGIEAEVQSQEPSYSAFGGARDPDAPAPSIEFSILHPAILVDKIIPGPMPPEIAAILDSISDREAGKPYSAFGDWFLKSQMKEALYPKGYLGAQIQIDQLAPQKAGDHYLVSISVSVNVGPQYHVSSITVGGGPLLAGKDLSPLYVLKAGDLPGRFPLSGLTSQLRAFYLRYGYADVDVETKPVLDPEHSLVAYHVDVIPGPVYHLRSVTVEKLDAAQEAKVRAILGMKPDDGYQEDAIAGLYRKLPSEPLLAGLEFGYSVKKDRAAGVIDLTLSFSKKDSGGGATVR